MPNTNIESSDYNPNYKVELKDRIVQFTPEGTAITCYYHLSDYAKHREVIKILTGGVSINNNKVRVYPQKEPYFNEYVYCLDAECRTIGPDSFSGGDGMQPGDTDHWVDAASDRSKDVIRRYSPILWDSRHLASGGAIITANYRSIRAAYHSDGNINFDFVNPQLTFNGNAISVDSWKLGWRYDNETPQFWALNTDTPGFVSECILGFTVQRLMVPDYQFRILQQNVIPAVMNKINASQLDLPGVESRGDGGIQYSFAPQTVRFDHAESTPHQDAYGNLYWTIQYDFSINYNLGAPGSGFEMRPIGWNALYNPRIRVGGREEHSGFMRVSTAPGFFDRTGWLGHLPGFTGAVGNVDIPRQNHSLYVVTNAIPTLFLNYD